jgi:hypothetical protein
VTSHLYTDTYNHVVGLHIFALLNNLIYPNKGVFIMSMFEIKCGDGTDNNCWGVVATNEIGIETRILTQDQIEYITDCLSDFNESEDDDDPFEIELEITKNQAEKSGLEISENELHDGFYTHSIEIHRPVCSVCGSGQTYDDEGNNITAL